ncbi:anaerobic sulfatase maturase [Pseudoxanthomonas sangjuensis]|uniref:anaerobic sulfatase maturase n=1 Tax=Pseudoxanthomonas sangjuensis TaxID=1503750 RepID=UPI001391F75F|nr:anaerobic sulfatase maturase [Pseudoxanthomonas sangjuensis]KAF1708738.1 anaerobic sulfatase maturase [Pseudoxanthomonas sangjuensis]
MSEPVEQGLHLMAKPVGPVCNLDCDYCFYLEKERLHAPRTKFRMSGETLRAYVRSYIAAQPTPEVEFTWQGGEPTLMGLGFFEEAVRLQREYAGGKTVRNTLQTNGTLLDEDWCAFLARERFTVGVSLDGPRELHGLHRYDKRGRSSFDDAMRGLALLQRHGVDYNVLVTVSREASRQPLEVYRFLKEQGVRHIQFNPVVERLPTPADRQRGQTFATPPEAGGAAGAPPELTPQSVESAAYGDFLIAVFDEWVRRDVGTVHVMNFEWALAAWCQLSATVCLFAPRCGKAAIVEHDGSVYSCDHYMYPEYRLGNLRETDAAALMASAKQRDFGAAKEEALPGICRRCDYRFACNGECPKNRFLASPDGEPGWNYLCAGYLKYFRHITQYMNAMAQLLAAGLPASAVMDAFDGPLVVRKRPAPHAPGTR